MLIMALFAVAVVILLFTKLGSERRKAGIRGWVVDQDLDGKGSRVYRDSKLGISCKPDVVERNRIIEYKSAVVMGKARQGDILYVAAQMLATGKAEADLRYANRGFTLKRKSSEMQAAMRGVRSIMGRMRRALNFRVAPKGTPTPGKCRVCMFNKECPDRSH